MPPVLDENRKYDAAFWREVLEQAKHIDGSKLVLVVAKQKIDQWCALNGGLTPSELRGLLEDVKSVIIQGRQRQGVIRQPPSPPSPPHPHLRVIK
ncbi:MAG: hypothetical protein HY690_19060 [Chloroflexi bacterium]|nr:hypothetical protein [Chloroflexota bacterium]